MVEVKDRVTGERENVPVTDAGARIAQVVRG
jgi:hypothetical protein